MCHEVLFVHFLFALAYYTYTSTLIYLDPVHVHRDDLPRDYSRIPLILTGINNVNKTRFVLFEISSVYELAAIFKTRERKQTVSSERKIAASTNRVCNNNNK